MRFVIVAIVIAISGGAGNAVASSVELFASGAQLSGANGIQFGPDGHLYVASVADSSIYVVDVAERRITNILGSETGVRSPDDIAFDSSGRLFWTDVYSGKVAGLAASGRLVQAGFIGVGANPITFSDDDRLFTARCFFGAGVYELDPNGKDAPRLITNDLGPDCGLNGMDFGPDGRLYGPRWFDGQIVSVDVATGETRVEADGVQVPAAVKFDSGGSLYVLDTMAGAVLVLEEDGSLRTFAELEQGLDNLAFDSSDNLYVSSYTDGWVARVSDGEVDQILRGGMTHPGGLAIHDDKLVVADLQSVRAYDLQTRVSSFVHRNVFMLSAVGANSAVSENGENLLLTSWIDRSVKVLNPKNGEVKSILTGLDLPVSAVAFRGGYAVALHGKRSVVLYSEEGVELKTLSGNLQAPTHIVRYRGGLLVSDRSAGTLIQIDETSANSVLVSGLDSPEGIAVIGDEVFVFEGRTGEIKSINKGSVRVVARLNPGEEAVSPMQPPSFILNGLVAHDGVLFASDEKSRSVYIIRP